MNWRILLSLWVTLAGALLTSMAGILSVVALFAMPGSGYAVTMGMLAVKGFLITVIGMVALALFHHLDHGD